MTSAQKDFTFQLIRLSIEELNVIESAVSCHNFLFARAIGARLLIDIQGLTSTIDDIIESQKEKE